MGLRTATVNKHIYARRQALAALTLTQPSREDNERHARLQRVAQSRADAAGKDVDWKKIANISLRVFSTEPEWPLVSAFIQWMKKDPKAALLAIHTVLTKAGEKGLRAFARTVPRERFPTPASRLGMGLALRGVQSARLIRETRITQVLRDRPVYGADRVATVPARDTKAPNLSGSRPSHSAGPSGSATEPAPGSTDEPAKDDSKLRPRSLPGQTAGPASSQAKPVSHEGRFAATGPGTVRAIPIEAFTTHAFRVLVEGGSDQEFDRERREARLVARYVEWLKERGVNAFRHEIRPQGLGDALYTDIFDPSLEEIIEAKASTRRSDVRMAVGQLLDYGRFVDHRSLAILTPVAITGDLCALLASHHFVNIYEDSGGRFCRSG
jgi:hypothetical protein